MDKTVPPETLVEDFIKKHKVMVFSKSWCPFCIKLFKHLDEKAIPYKFLHLDLLSEYGDDIQRYLQRKTGQSSVPNVFINERHVGGCDSMLAASASGQLLDWLDGEFEVYEFELLVIGGGSGGIAAAKEAALHSKRVALCDFVKPSPQGSTWGIGGTCVNVGCIPKKLMHTAAIINDNISHAPEFGFELNASEPHNWETMVTSVQDYIKSLNWNYRKELKKFGVKYFNAHGTIIDTHKAKLVLADGSEKIVTSQNFIIATGGRPSYLELPGAREYCITSDDLFSLNRSPGKTLVIGASYIALECAGFLKSLGLDVTVMVRSILLRGFDRDMAEMIGKNMEGMGVKFQKECTPVKIELVSADPKAIMVVGVCSDGTEVKDTYETVLLAVGREPCTSEVFDPSLEINLNLRNKKIIVNKAECTNIRSVHAVGDVVDGKPELTPVAIKAGTLLARRLFGKTTALMDYAYVPTTVFTPLEYGSVGMSEELATNSFGSDNIEVYHGMFKPLEWELSNSGRETQCYAKLICMKNPETKQPSTVVGLHVLGPNAGEITQGFSLALKLGATKSDFDGLVGIHPTCAEVFTDLRVTKSSGLSIEKSGC